MACNEFLEKHKTKKTEMKVFLVGGTMLTGKVTDFDDKAITLNECLIFLDRINSITPF